MKYQSRPEENSGKWPGLNGKAVMVRQAAPTQIPSSVEACPRNKQHVYPVPRALGNDKKP